MIAFVSSGMACPKYIREDCGFYRPIDENDPHFKSLTKKNQYNIKRNNKFNDKVC